MGRAVVVMVAPAEIVMVSCWVGEMFPALSFAVTPKVKNGLPTGVVGVPLIVPEELSVKPCGNEPVRVQVYGATPPTAVNVVE